jgi:hypothetical protein
MSDETSAPGGGDSEAISVVTPAADTPADISISQAARALRAARKPKEPAPSAEPAAEQPQLADEADAAPVEQAPGEEPTEVEPEAIPPLDPPRSWTKEAKDRWNALPREAQEEVARIEQSREREFRRSQNEAAEKLKGLTAKEQAVEQARKEYEAKLPAIMQALQDAQAGAFADIKNMDDVTKLSTEDPFRYLQWQAHQQKLQAVNHEMMKAEERKTQEQQTQWAEHVQKENKLFAEAVPEFADKAKAKELTDKAVETLLDVGFTDQELGELATGKSKLSIYDHRVQQLILGNVKWNDAQKARTAVTAKPVPPVQRPGVAKPQGAAASEALQALATKFESTGSLKDAAALRMAQVKAQQRRAS